MTTSNATCTAFDPVYDGPADDPSNYCNDCGAVAAVHSTPTGRQLADALGWLEDCFAELPGDLTPAEIAAGVERHYEGGWAQFAADGAYGPEPEPQPEAPARAPHFHAGHNDAGYLPEADTATFSSWEDAKAYMIAELLETADNVASWGEPHDCDDVPCPTFGDNCPEQLANSASLEAESLNLEGGPEWQAYSSDGRSLPVSWWITPCAEEECGPEPDEDTARRLASEWHSGQWSALYAFASSGHIRPDLRVEVEREVTDPGDRAYLLTFLGPEPDPSDDVTGEEEAMAYLLRYGNLSVPCSRYGHDSRTCAEVAWQLAQAVEEANGEATTYEGLEHLMGLVVNDHDDVASLLGLDDEEEEDEEEGEEAPDFWALLETPPAGREEVAALWSWSLNYDTGTGPATLFLDLIGHSQEEYGQALYDLDDASLGHRELEYLRDALSEYLADPHGVRGFVSTLLEAESAR